MTSCWESDSQARPNFAQLADLLLALIPDERQKNESLALREEHETFNEALDQL